MDSDPEDPERGTCGGTGSYRQSVGSITSGEGAPDAEAWWNVCHWAEEAGSGNASLLEEAQGCGEVEVVGAPMARIFLSFVHEDQTVAAAVQSILTEFVGEDAFMSSDQTQVFAGDRWFEKISQSLQDARLVILMLSKRSVDRAWVNFEAGAAWFTNKPIIPCCYGNMSKATLPHPYSAVQALNLPDDWEYLLESVCHHLGVTLKEDMHIQRSGRAFDRLREAVAQFTDVEKRMVVKKKKPAEAKK
jgi:hypothetical protein